MTMLSDIVKTVGKEYATLASEIRENELFIDTGSYIFNALVSGSIFGGFSGNKITGIAGESSTGKTFFALAVLKNFLNNNPTGVCLYFDSESAITKKLLVDRGIDVTRVVLLDVATVEDFRTKALKAADMYAKKPEEERIPMLFILDSLGMLPTTKEVQDTLDDKQVRDMSKAQLIKGTFRMLTMRLGKANIPMIVTNHTYQTMSLYGGPEVSGGSGFKYAASTIIMLSKSKEKDGTDVVGNIIRARTHKSRLSKENQQVEIRLFYDERGLDKYYGLPQLAAEAGIWPAKGNRYEIDGKKVWEKEILKNPQLYFTDEVMEQLDVVAQGLFQYGGGGEVGEDTEEETEEDGEV